MPRVVFKNLTEETLVMSCKPSVPVHGGWKTIVQYFVVKILLCCSEIFGKWIFSKCTDTMHSIFWNQYISQDEKIANLFLFLKLLEKPF